MWFLGQELDIVRGDLAEITRACSSHSSLGSDNHCSGLSFSSSRKAVLRRTLHTHRLCPCSLKKRVRLLLLILKWQSRNPEPNNEGVSPELNVKAQIHIQCTLSTGHCLLQQAGEELGLGDHWINLKQITDLIGHFYRSKYHLMSGTKSKNSHNFHSNIYTYINTHTHSHLFQVGISEFLLQHIKGRCANGSLPVFTYCW